MSNIKTKPNNKHKIENNTMIHYIKYLPDDIKNYILQCISPLKLVFINKFFYLKYHQLYLFNKYMTYFESIEQNKTAVYDRIIPHIERSNIIENINISNNFHFSKVFIKILIHTIKSNYGFLLNVLLHDGEIILYKIEEQMRSSEPFCKWLKLSYKGSSAIYYNSLYSYIKCICGIYKPSKDIIKLLDVYYFNKNGNCNENCNENCNGIRNSICDNYIKQKQEIIQTIPIILFNNNLNENEEEYNENYEKEYVEEHNIIDDSINNDIKQTYKRKERKLEKKQQKERSQNTKKQKRKNDKWGNI